VGHHKLSVLLPTFNNADILRPTLESIRWADEIVVVDSYSTDATLDLCKTYGARILQHEYIQSAKQKNWAIPQCAFDWILQVDSDEILEVGLKQEIQSALEMVSAETNGFQIPFKHHILGEWVRVCDLYPEYHLRLFRRDKGCFQDKEVHSHVQVPGTVKTLDHHILHYGMTSISKQLRNVDRYSRYQADELHKRGKKFHWYQVTLRPIAIFMYYYFLRQGFTAGYRGVILSALNATFDFWSHAKLWELETFHLPASPK
jgi:glycosyltransferase involved in cell wall biosynthesis